MHIYTILGAALADAGIRELLFSNPLDAAKRLGISLSNLEVTTLRRIIQAGGDDLANGFQELSIQICPTRPCPLALAAEDDASMSSAAD